MYYKFLASKFKLQIDEHSNNIWQLRVEVHHVLRKVLRPNNQYKNLILSVWHLGVQLVVENGGVEAFSCE
jgi:hypothetical protein